MSNAPNSQVLSGQKTDHWTEQHDRDKNPTEVVSRENGWWGLETKEYRQFFEEFCCNGMRNSGVVDGDRGGVNIKRKENFLYLFSW